jgi:hypothetical protein
MRPRIRDTGFPLLVIAALAVAGYLAASVRVPTPTPDFALQAAAVYRLEVGAACFAAFYLAAMALVLALDGRGFAEVGTKGLRAVEVVRTTDDQQAGLSELIELNRSVRNDLKKAEAALRSTNKTLNEQEKRLDRLEKEQLK